MSDSSSTKPSKARVFWARTSSTLVLWGVFIGALVTGSQPMFFILIAGLSFLGLWEFLAMLQQEGKVANAIRSWTLLCAAAYLTLFFFFPDWQTLLDMAAFFVLAGGVLTMTLVEPVDGRKTLEKIVAPVFGFFYVVFLFNFLTRILQFDNVDNTHLYIFLGLIVTKFTDMGAYITGTLIGKTKMIPHISPGKTWEGIIGAVFIAQAGGFVVWWILGEKLDWLLWQDVLILGFVLPVAAVIGDLAESVFKRSVSVKDSGKMLPGIGGALDLIDSILFTAPLMYFYLLLKHG